MISIDLILGGITLTAFTVAGVLALRVITLARTARKHRLLSELSAQVNRAILLNEEGDRIFTTILDYALRILEQANLGSVLALDESGYLTLVAGRGFPEDYMKNFRIKLEDTWQYRQTGGTMADALIITPETILRSGYKHDEWTWQYRTVLSAPLRVGDRLYGILNIDSRREKTFGAQDLEVLRRFQAQIEVCLLARERYRITLADSRIDGLTRFLNRAAFAERLAESLDHAERYGDDLTIGMFDVDGLKGVNDRWGHAAGDKLLKTAADALRSTARKSDVLGRWGGDEFVAVYHGTDPRVMGERTARTLIDLGHNPVDLGEASVRASFCYGFAQYPAEGGTPESLIAAADQRMYAMKAARTKG